MFTSISHDISGTGICGWTVAHQLLEIYNVIGRHYISTVSSKRLEWSQRTHPVQDTPMPVPSIHPLLAAHRRIRSNSDPRIVGTYRSQNSFCSKSVMNSTLRRATTSGMSIDHTCAFTWRLSDEFGEPESLGRMHEIVHKLVQSREAIISDRVWLS